jgi:hypothetical protein
VWSPSWDDVADGEVDEFLKMAKRLPIFAGISLHFNLIVFTAEWTLYSQYLLR